MNIQNLNLPFIINSLLDVDFYKFTMGQLIFKKFAEVPVRLGFKCRTKGIELGDFISESELRRELDHVRTLKISNTELHYLRGTNEYSDRMFEEDYLNFLRTLELPDYELEYKDGKFVRLEFPGPWSTATYWETIALAIVNELYYRKQTSSLSTFEQDLVCARGQIKLAEKIKILLENPQITFSEFGTRRRFSGKWQNYIVETLSKELPSSQFKGTSNVLLAMNHGLLPMGTNAHEIPMVLAGIMQRDDDELRKSQHEVLRLWWDQYGEGLSIMLPDTFGSNYLFRTLTRDQAEKWKGFRHDSGDPFKFGETVIKFYKTLGINSRKKIIVFSDGLDIETMLEIEKRFRGQIIVTFGWGTNLTNDMGFRPLSLVIKVIEACGNMLVKLSDDLGKGMGPDEVKERYVRAFDYHTTFMATPIY